MLSACSWEGITLQREQLTANVHCAAVSIVRGLGWLPRTHLYFLSRLGQPAPRDGWGEGQVYL